MSRNPYARSVRAKPQQVIPDKREKISRDLHQLFDEYATEDLPPEWLRLLDELE